MLLLHFRNQVSYFSSIHQYQLSKQTTELMEKIFRNSKYPLMRILLINLFAEIILSNYFESLKKIKK